MKLLYPHAPPYWCNYSTVPQTARFPAYTEALTRQIEVLIDFRPQFRDIAFADISAHAMVLDALSQAVFVVRGMEYDGNPGYLAVGSENGRKVVAGERRHIDVEQH